MASFLIGPASPPAHGAVSAWSYWSFNPLIIALLAVTIMLYVRGWRALARRTGEPGKVLKRRAWLFTAGMVVLAVALVSPVDGLAEELFSMHMVQHTLLVMAAAPLLVLSYPLPEMILGLPKRVQRMVGRGWRRSPWLRVSWQMLSLPLVAWLLHVGLFWLWHAPVLYQAAIENDAIHALEHASFLGPALLFWWVALHTFGNNYEKTGFGILYLFAAMMQGGLLGALLTFSTRAWYPIYEATTEAWGRSALADQQLAGIIMWVPAGLAYLAGVLILMKIWLDGMENRAKPAEERPTPEKPARSSN